MRCFVVAHACIDPQNRVRWKKLVERHPDVSVRIVIPEIWVDLRHRLHRLVRPEMEKSERFEVVGLPVFNAGDITLHVYRSLALSVRQFQPDVIAVFQNRATLSFLQTLAVKRVFARRAKCVHITVTNVPWPLDRLSRKLRHRFVLSTLDGALAGSPRAKQLLEEMGFRKPVEVVSEMSLDEDFYKPGDALDVRSKLGLNRFVVGYAGALERTKGVQDIVQACKLLNDVDVLLVGDGPLRADLQAMMHELPPPVRLHMTGYVPKSRLCELYKAMDVLILASRTTPTVREQTGCALAEAMGSGVPVICSSSGEMHFVVGDAGIVYPEGDVDALGVAIERVRKSPEIRAQMVERGRQRFLDFFAATAVADRTYEFFTRLLAG